MRFRGRVSWRGLALGIALAVISTAFQAHIVWAEEGEGPIVDPNAAAAAKVERSTRIQARAYLDRRRPVAGATVRVLSEEGTGRVYLSTTDERGRVRIYNIPDGSYLVTFDKPGLAPVVKDRVVVKAPMRAVLEVPMNPAAGSGSPATVHSALGLEVPENEITVDIDLEVVNAAGNAVPDVAFRLVRADGTEDPVRFRSDPGGKFTIGNIRSGMWDLEIVGIGYLPIRTRVLIDRPGEATIQLVRQPSDYDAEPLDLMPDEQPIAPAAFRKEPPPEVPAAMAEDGGA